MRNVATAALLQSLRDIVQVDVGNRGLARDPVDNLLTACPDDFANACRSIAEHPSPRVGIVTGFMIPDGRSAHWRDRRAARGHFPGKSLRQARHRLGTVVRRFGTERHSECHLDLARVGQGRICRTSCRDANLTVLRQEPNAKAYRDKTLGDLSPITHLIAVERVGVNYRPRTLRSQPTSTYDNVVDFMDRVPQGQRKRCFTMRGRDITDLTNPAHLLFEQPRPYTTIGIGDGGNEIGMGKIAWSTIRMNIPGGELIASSVATDHLIVAGVSNWGAYALAAGVMLLRGKFAAKLFDPDSERYILENMVEFGPLVDGVTGQRTATVDGLSFAEYVKPLIQIGQLLASRAA